MALNEQLRKGESSLEVLSSVGAGQGLTLDAIGGGVVLLTVFGEVMPIEPDTATAAINRDTWQIDLAPWIKDHAADGNPADTAEIVTHAFKLAHLWRSAPQVGEAASDDQAAALANFRAAAANAPGEASAPGRPSDFDANTDPSLGRWLTLRAAADEVIDALAASLNSPASQASRALGEPVQAEFAEAHEASPETAQKLYRPLGTLISRGLVENDSIDGLYQKVTYLAPYGGIKSKLAISVPADLNGQPIPMTSTDAIAFANHALEVAGR